MEIPSKGALKDKRKRKSLKRLTHNGYTFSKQVAIRLVDPKAAQVIDEIQKKNIPVIGFAYRQPDLAEITLRQVASLGVYFSQKGPCAQEFKLDHAYSPAFRSGILFIHEFNEKGAVLKPFFCCFN